MIQYPKALYRPVGKHDFSSTEVALDSLLVHSLVEERAAIRAGWSEWRRARKRSEALCRRNQRIAAVRQFFHEWRWAFEAFAVVGGSISIVVAYIAKN